MVSGKIRNFPETCGRIATYPAFAIFMKYCFPAFALLLLLGGCCNKKLCTGAAMLEFTGFSKDELEKGICKAVSGGWKGDRPINGQTRVSISVTESPMYVYFPADTLAITVFFRKDRCNNCAFGFMDPEYEEVSGFEFRGKKYDGNTLIIPK